MSEKVMIAAYREMYPYSPLNDTQVGCIAPLLSVHALHNWRHYIAGWRNADGGFRACGPDGIYVLMKNGFLSTYDDSRLTRLVVAAHVHACRVEVSAHGFGYLRIQINQRTHDGETRFTRHPTVDQVFQVAKDLQNA